MMIKCLNCGSVKAVATQEGLHCVACRHRWSFQDELDNSTYIIKVLGREPILGFNAAEAVTTNALPVTDDFTLIDGIGGKRAAQLRGLGVETYADLAAMSPEVLAAEFNGVNTEDALSWIAQAEVLKHA